MRKSSEKPKPPDGPANNAANLTTSRLRRFINDMPAGTTFTTADCLQYGPRTSIDKALSRLVAAGRLIRLAYGVFVRNDDDDKLPSVLEIAQAKARAFGKRIYEHAKDTAKKLKLVPAGNEEPTFLIHGGTTSFATIHARVHFIGTSARKTRNRGSKSAEVLAALWYMGAEQVTGQTVQLATRELFRQDYDELHASGGLVPSWLAKLIARTWKWHPPVMVSA